MARGGEARGATALVVVDVLDPFDHPDGETVLRAMRERLDAMADTLAHARRDGRAVVYVNDHHGARDGQELLRRARAGAGGDVVGGPEPRDCEALVLQSSYSAFDGTPLAALIERAGAEELVLMGAVTEMCVRESAIDATRLGHRTALVPCACVSLDPGLERLALEALNRLSGVRLRPVPGGAGE
jgi:nicotinamidase-related amidase